MTYYAEPGPLTKGGAALAALPRPVPDLLPAGLDHLAAITAVPGTAAESRARYQSEQFRVPARFYNFIRQTDEPVLEAGRYLDRWVSTTDRW